MDYYLGFLNIKNDLIRAFEIIQNPILFFQKNKDKDERLVEFIRSMILASVIITSLVNILMGTEDPWVLLFSAMIAILLAPIIARVTLWFSSLIINWIAYYIFSLDNRQAAKRVVAYTTITMLIPNVEIVSLSVLSVLVGLTLYTIGLSKQYKTTYVKAFLITVIPWFIIGALFFIIMALTMNGFVLVFG